MLPFAWFLVVLIFKMNGFVIRSGSMKVRLAPSATFADVRLSFGPDVQLSFIDDEGELNLVRNDAELQGAAFYMREKKEIALQLVSCAPVPPTPPSVVRAARPVTPVERHSMLSSLLSLGFYDMTKNLMTLKKADYSLEKSIQMLKAERDQVNSSPPPHVRSSPLTLTPEARHVLLGQLVQFGFKNMERNLLVLKRASTLEEAVELLLAAQQEGDDSFDLAPLRKMRLSAPSPKEALSVQERHETLARLISLGYCDMQKNLKALREGGSLEEVIQRLRSKDADEGRSRHNNNNE